MAWQGDETIVRKIFVIIKKNILLRFNSPVEWLFFVILPVIFILVLSGGTGGPSDPRYPLVVVDQAQTDLSFALFNELEKSTSITPAQMELKNAVSDFDSHQISAFLIIPEEFTMSALKEGTAEIEFRQQPNNLNALIAQQAVQTAAGSLSSLIEIANTSMAKANEIHHFDSE